MCKWLDSLTGDPVSIHQHELAHGGFPVSEGLYQILSRSSMRVLARLQKVTPCLRRFSNGTSCERYGCKDFNRPCKSCSWRLTFAIAASKDGSINRLTRDGSVCLTGWLGIFWGSGVEPLQWLQVKKFPLKCICVCIYNECNSSIFYD